MASSCSHRGPWVHEKRSCPAVEGIIAGLSELCLRFKDVKSGFTISRLEQLACQLARRKTWHVRCDVSSP